MYARIVYDDSSERPRRALAFSRDFGQTFTVGDASGFPGNPGADAEGAFLIDLIWDDASAETAPRDEGGELIGLALAGFAHRVRGARERSAACP